MNKIKLPFIWSSNLPSIALITFSVYSGKLNFPVDELSPPFTGFYIDLKDGQILGVNPDISSGNAYRYPHCESFLIEGKGWWIGFNELDSEPDYFFSSDIEIENILTRVNFNFIVDNVCNFARENNLNDFISTGDMYMNFIGNDDCPTL